MAAGQTIRKGRFLPVMFTVVAVGALLILSYFLIFMNPNLDRLNDQPHCSLTGHSFLNPYDGPVTRNGGGWALQIGTVSGPTVPLEDLVVAVSSPAGGGFPSQVWWFKVKGTGTNSSDLAVNGWYLRAGNRTGPSLRFANGTVPMILNNTTAPSLREDEFPTVEGAVLVYRDMDLDGNLSIGDRIIAYKDVNGNGIVDLRPGTLLEIQTTGGKLVASAHLD